MFGVGYGQKLLEQILERGWQRAPAYDTPDLWSWIVHITGRGQRLIQVHQTTGEVLIRMANGEPSDENEDG